MYDLQCGQAGNWFTPRRDLQCPLFLRNFTHSALQWLHIIDLDAAMNRGHNNALVAETLQNGRRRKYKMSACSGGIPRSPARQLLNSAHPGDYCRRLQNAN